MRRDQLEHAIRTACQIIGRPEVIVVGSQSILGTFREDELPAAATMSVEIDILPIADGNAEIKRLADLIEGAVGELSRFEELHGFSIDGVDMETSALPEGWRDRLVKVQNANTAAPTGEPQFTGWCLGAREGCLQRVDQAVDLVGGEPAAFEGSSGFLEDRAAPPDVDHAGFGQAEEEVPDRGGVENVGVEEEARPPDAHPS
jgi:hypothetical protein